MAQGMPRLMTTGRRLQVAALVVCAFTQVAAISAIGHAVSGIAEQPGEDYPAMLAIAAAAILFVSAGRYLERVLGEHLAQNFVVDIRDRLISHLLRLDRSDGKNREASVVVRFAGDIGAQRNWAGRAVPRMIAGSITLAGAGTYLSLVSPWLGLLFLLVCLLAVATNALNQRGLRIRTVEVRKQRSRMLGQITRTYRHLLAHQHLGALRQTSAGLKRQSRKASASAVALARRAGWGQATAEASAFGLPIVLLMASTLLALATPAEAVSALAVTVIVAPRFRELGRVHEYVVAARVSRQHLEGFLSLPRIRAARRRGNLRVDEGILTCRKVKRSPSLKGVDMTARPGDRIHLVGDNGAGKSTLMRTIAGLAPVERGDIRIDGQSLRRVSARSWRRRVSLVSADIPLLPGTLRGNLMRGLKSDADAETAMLELAAELGLDRLSGWPEHGFDLRVADGGTNLSEGQRELIRIARALIRRPAILLIDEAGAHLDAEAVLRVSDCLSRFKGVLVMVSHDGRLAGVCNRVLELSGGRLLDQPEHREQPNLRLLEKATC